MKEATLLTKDSISTRAFSTFEVKAVDDDKRILEGIASTPVTDRVGDIVEPKGAQYKLPLPFLWQHDKGKPIGHVISAKITDAGIAVKVQIESDDEPGPLKDMLDLAWRSIKKGLVRGMSIGFRPIEAADIKGSWGQRFTKWDWLELSAVTIAANSDASITSIKSAALAASGTQSTSTKAPGVSGSIALRKPGDKPVKKSLADRIAALDETRKAKKLRLDEITEKVSDEARTKDAAEREEFDTLRGEIKSLDAELEDLRDMETLEIKSATSVDDEARRNASRPAQRTTQAPGGHVQVKNTEKLEPGIRIARLAKCMTIAAVEQSKGRFVTADSLAKSLFPQDEMLNGILHKAAVAAGTTASGNWAEDLVSDEGGMYADFVEFLRPQTILGRFGNGGVPALRRVPFRVPLVGSTGGGTGYWVGEGNAKPLTAFDFSRTTLTPLKVANIAVASMEVLRDSSPSAEMMIRDGLVAALRERLDIDFIDPTKTASAGVSPASITNGATTVASSGTDADAVRADIQALFATFIANNNAPTTGVWVMPSTTALALALMQNPLGQSEFPGVNMNGGTLFGLPVIVSEYVPSDTAGAVVALINASDVYLADDGGFNVSVSREASLQMDSAPDNPTTATTVMVSLWQRNLVGFLAERTINWARRRTGSVAYLTGVLWGTGA